MEIAHLIAVANHTLQHLIMTNQNITWHRPHVGSTERVNLYKQKPLTLWLTGYSGAGKSTLAFALESHLVALGHATYVLDGDNVRHGLNRDLGFSHDDRTENIRRVAEVANLFNDAGIIVITAFISPYRADRAIARSIIGKDRFIESWLSTDLETCEHRDPKGLYMKARAGKIAEFTGISAPYENPEAPELTVDAGHADLDVCISQVITHISPWLKP